MKGKCNLNGFQVSLGLAITGFIVGMSIWLLTSSGFETWGNYRW